MCTILDNAINKGIEQGIERGITQGENLKLIMQVQKKMKKGDSITKIADDLVEDEIVILPIYKMVKDHELSFTLHNHRNIYGNLLLSIWKYCISCATKK